MAKQKKEEMQAVVEAKKGLAELFGGKALRSKEAVALRTAATRADRTEAARSYVDAWGIPQDLGLLALFLRQKDGDLMTRALEEMPGLLPHAAPAELKLIRSAVQAAVLTMTKAEARRAAKQVLAIVDT